MNNAMITSVMTFIEDPWRYALTRSSGTRGSDAYEELVTRGYVQLWISIPNINTDVVHIPIHYTQSSLWKEGFTVPICDRGGELIHDDVVCPNNRLWVVNNPAPFAVSEEGDAFVTLGISLWSGNHCSKQHTNHPIHDNGDLPFLRHVVVTHCESLESLRCLPHSGIYELTVELIDEGADCTAAVWSREEGAVTPTNLLASVMGLRHVNLPELPNTTVVQKGFLSDNTSLKYFDLTCIRSATEIQAEFLGGCVSLSEVDLGPLSKEGSPVLSIEPKFLAGSGIRTLDVSPLHAISTIPSLFLDGCRSLTHMDISPLTNLTAIGDHFMRGCSSLLSIQLGGKGNVIDDKDGTRAVSDVDIAIMKIIVRIPNNFLALCPKLKSINLAPLGNVTIIERCFMKGCRGLESLDLRPLSKVTEVGPEFLENCETILELDVGPLSNVLVVSDSFLLGCSGLKNIHNFNAFHLLSEIGDNFASQCTSLEFIEFPAHPLKSVGKHLLSGCIQLSAAPANLGYILSKLEAISSHFMYTCGGISDVNLQDVFSPPTSSRHVLIGQVGYGFLQAWSSLTQLDLRSLSNVTLIGGAFLYGCRHLTHLDITPLQHITEIPPLFLSECSGLLGLDLRPLGNCAVVHEGFLRGCSSLTAITLTPLRKIHHIPSYFLSRCSRLEFVDFGGLDKVETISDNFLSDCVSLVEVDITPLRKCKTISQFHLFENCPPDQVVRALNSTIATTLQTCKRCKESLMNVVVS